MSDVTNTKCREVCRTTNFRFAATQGDSCWCSDDNVAIGDPPSGKDCSSPCKGDNTEFCGGNALAMVWDLEPRWTYDGCYTDTDSPEIRALPHKVYRSWTKYE